MITALMLVLVVVGLLAQTVEMKEKKEATGQPMMRWEESLNLTQKQIDSITSARTAYDKQRNTISAQIKNLNVDIAEAIKKQDFKKAKTLNKQLTDKDLELKNARIDMLSAMLKDLDAEQRESILARLSLHSSREGMGFPMMGQRGDGRGFRDGSCYPDYRRPGNRNTAHRQMRDNKQRFRQASPRK